MTQMRETFGWKCERAVCVHVLAAGFLLLTFSGTRESCESDNFPQDWLAVFPGMKIDSVSRNVVDEKR